MADRRDFEQAAQVTVSVIVVLAYGAIVFLLLFKPVQIDQNTKDILNIMLGALTASFTGIVQFWTGSSSGSRRKDDAISAIAQTSVAPTPPAEN